MYRHGCILHVHVCDGLLPYVHLTNSFMNTSLFASLACYLCQGGYLVLLGRSVGGITRKKFWMNFDEIFQRMNFDETVQRGTHHCEKQRSDTGAIWIQETEFVVFNIAKIGHYGTSSYMLVLVCNRKMAPLTYTK